MSNISNQELNTFLSYDFKNTVSLLKKSKKLFLKFKHQNSELDKILSKIIEVLKKELKEERTFENNIHTYFSLKELIEILIANKIVKHPKYKEMEKLFLDLGKIIEIPSKSVSLTLPSVSDNLKELTGRELNKFLSKFVTTFSETWSTVKMTEEERKKYPLHDLFSSGKTTIINSDGGYTEKEEDVELFMLGCSHLANVIQKLELNETKINFLFENSTILDATDRLLLSKALNYFFSKKYDVFLYLAVPRIENMFRNIIRNNNGEVLGNISKTGFKYKILNEIFEDEKIKEIFSEEAIKQFRIILSNNANVLGMNLRNEITHGIYVVSEDTALHSHIVFLTLLFLFHL